MFHLTFRGQWALCKCKKKKSKLFDFLKHNQQEMTNMQIIVTRNIQQQPGANTRNAHHQTDGKDN